MNKSRVLVADDHEEMRWAIARVLRDHFEVVGLVADGKSLVDAALLLQPDVIVSDIVMPVLTGPEAMKELESRCHGAPFVLMSGNLSGLERWIEQGAVAFVDKCDIGYELVAAVRSAAAGEIYLSSGARSYILDNALLQRSSLRKSRYAH